MSPSKAEAYIGTLPGGFRRLHPAHVRRLGRRLRVEIAIDPTGWLGERDVELAFSRRGDGTIRPVRVRVGPDAREDDVAGNRGVLARCGDYNRVLARLRQLARQLGKAIRQGRIRLVPGSPAAYAHHQLSRLDELIAYRQELMMGNGVVHAATLVREIDFFERSDAHLAPIVLAAENVSGGPSRLAAWAARRMWRWLCC